MRLLFVYQDYAEKARKLVKALAVNDVAVIVVRKKEDSPSREELDLIGNEHPAAAICQVVRRYRRTIQDLVNIQYEAKSFREKDLQLEQWLQPKFSETKEVLLPSLIFARNKAKCEHLIVARSALEAADKIHQRRWAFVQSSFSLLNRHAKNENLGPMREWKSRFGIEFAANGRVRYCCQVPGRKDKWPYSEWHLKEGDRTAPEDAARIYFDVIEIDGQTRVIISYVGPHPEDGDYTALIDI